MSSFFVLDVPENEGVVRVAAECPGTTLGMVGPYYRISFAAAIHIDRRATGCRHAVWYSAVAGLQGSRITKHDKNALHIVA